MTVQKHLFLIDPISRLNLNIDSTLQMAAALVKRGHLAYLCSINELSWDGSKHGAQAHVQQLLSWERVVSSTPRSKPKLDLTRSSCAELSDFTAIHMRKEPPLDSQYLAATWLLDSVKGKTRLFNTPEALRSFNEKAVILSFPQARAKALISSKPEAILNFIRKECAGHGIIKPLDQFAGRGIFVLNLEETTDLQAKKQLTNATSQGEIFKIIQPFDPAVYSGEIRLFTVAGQPLAWVKKKPAKGHYLANTLHGASLHPYEPSAQLKALMTSLATTLYHQGVALAGFDIIDGKLSEINITSPRLLIAPGDQSDYYGKIAEWFETECESHQ